MHSHNSIIIIDVLDNKKEKKNKITSIIEQYT